MILKPPRVSARTVVTWVLIGGLSILAGAVIKSLPILMNLDALRPRIIAFIEDAAGAHVLLGNVHLEFFPYLGVRAGPIVLSERSDPKHLLAAAQSVRLMISWRTIVERRLRVGAVRFWKPRIILRRERTSSGTRWIFPAAERPAAPAPGAPNTMQWQFRAGKIDIVDETHSPRRRWALDQIDGSFDPASNGVQAAGEIPSAGRRCRFDVRTRRGASFPIRAHITGIDIAALRQSFGISTGLFDGSASITAQGRLDPAWAIQGDVAPIDIKALRGAKIGATFSVDPNHFQASLRAGTTAPMTVDVAGVVRNAAWMADTTVKGYAPSIVNTFYEQFWVNRLSGRGTITSHTQRNSDGSWFVSATGRDFTLSDSELRIPEFTVQVDTGAVTVRAKALSAAGSADVIWHQRSNEIVSALAVSVTSTTIREVVSAFKPPANAPTAASTGKMNPYGYQPWLITQGAMQGVISPGPYLEVDEGEFDLIGMHLSVTGAFDLHPQSSRAQIDGALERVPVGRVLESFFPPPAEMTGTGRATFSLTFPLSSAWINGLDGQLDIEDDQGLLKGFATLYRIASVLNLSNFLRLRFPGMTARGVPFETLTGHLDVTQGKLQTRDLFLRSSNMNVGAQGVLDLPGERIDATLRLQLLRFFEDLFKDATFLRWIMKGSHKILLPLIVVVRGPWDHVEIH